MKKSEALARIVELQEENILLKDELNTMTEECQTKQELIDELLEKLSDYDQLQKENEELKAKLEMVSDEVRLMEAKSEVNYLRHKYHWAAEDLLDEFYEVQKAIKKLDEICVNAREKFAALNHKVHDSYFRLTDTEDKKANQSQGGNQ